ncbi:protein tyrosine phosphatase domain-containing protein 1-like isoform X3 [Polyodon spathula]|uniref:protein tyrosine phosphatase domain-containing protein 1-like isoform X3 n=1 Tax=Polyodon spathula TaxID=7913 RepID=UPI001B7E111A|nr:protein tyrosine phosphatase domain-containing protein 1-like isoform X3 [Polyodon spathula]
MAAVVSLQNEITYSPIVVNSWGFNPEMESAITRRPTAKYTKVGERLRHVIPGYMQCSMACGGRACKYENPSRWSDEEQAIKGLYSSWITDNLLAMARPSTEIIEKYNIIKQFQRYDVKTIINLQRPGEHASCGNSLEQESGFTYQPEIFMDAGIYFYNFGWKDYGVASLTTILDMVKVMSFAMQEGKLAIHCHAGLGRTGVLLACYLVFAVRMTADQAILFVRAKRPNSIQTRGQLLCVREFAQFLIPLRNVFACAEPKANAVTLSQYLIRQRHLLHGYEARQLKNVPKIVQLICKLLLDIAENRQVIEEEVLEIPDLSAEIEKTVSQLAILQLDKELHGKGVERELNSREGAWDRISTERDPFVLSGLMWSWLEQLKEPVITKQDIQILVQKCDNLDEAIYTLEKGPQQTIVSIVDCVAHLHSIPEDVDEAFLARITKAFTKITFDAADGPMVYSTLKAILKPVLYEKRRAIEEAENSCHCLYCP